ncbi:50S ribosomal protein L6 [bacterium]|nr:50S ribosomal protein L6 [bacterium]
MSRVGKSLIHLPEGVQVEKKGHDIIVKGQKGELKQAIHPDIKVIIEENTIQVERPSENKFHKSLHGLTRSLIQNMITGMTDGFEKKLEIVGVGYRAEMKGKTLALQLGYSHPIYFIPPDGIILEVTSPTNITVKGIDKQLVGQVAAKIRSFRLPEPYKGKGVRYEKEYVRRKAGKATA